VRRTAEGTLVAEGRFNAKTRIAYKTTLCAGKQVRAIMRRSRAISFFFRAARRRHVSGAHPMMSSI